MSGCRGVDAPMSPRHCRRCTKLFWGIWKWWGLRLQFLYGKREKTQSCIGKSRIPKRICFQQYAHRKGWPYGVPRGCHLCISTLNVTDGQKSESKVQIPLFIGSTWNLNPSTCFGRHWSHTPFNVQEPRKKEITTMFFTCHSLNA